MIFAVAAAFAFAMGTLTGAVNASTITFYDNPADTTTGERGTLTCSAGCSALFSTPSIYDSTTGGVFTVHPPTVANQISFINANRQSGEASFATGFKTEPAVSPFTTNALYVLLKIGGGATFNSLLVRNESGAGGLQLT